MRRVVLCVFLLIPSWAWSQAGEYRKLMESQPNQTAEAFFFALQDFQKQNPQFSNVYFQLGEANLGFFASLDPVIDRVGSRQYIYNAKINYGLSKSFFDEKEAFKNPEWYGLPNIRERD